MANLYDFTERLKLLLYLNHRKSSVNTMHFYVNFRAVDDFAREMDQKFVDQDAARGQLQADLLEIIRTNKAAFDNHAADQTNPHAVTKLQVGLGNVPNVTTNDQTPSYTTATALAALVSGEKLSSAFGKLAKGTTDLI